jgi:hypothetical protein
MIGNLGAVLTQFLRHVTPLVGVAFFLPAAPRPTLFDHLVGAREQCRWNVTAERLCRLEVDDQYAEHSNFIVITICYAQIRQRLGTA